MRCTNRSASSPFATSAIEKTDSDKARPYEVPHVGRIVDDEDAFCAHTA
jgi:hypothetical protein